MVCCFDWCCWSAVCGSQRGTQPQFQVETGPSVFVVFVIAEFLPRRALQARAVGGVRSAGARQRAGDQPQFQVETGANWAAVVFVIAVFLPRRALRPEAGGVVQGCSWSRGSGEVQPQFQVETGRGGGGGVRHCGVPSEAGAEARSWGGGAGVLPVSGRSAPVPGGDRAELGGVVFVIAEFLPRGRALPARGEGGAAGAAVSGRLSPSSSWRPGQGVRRVRHCGVPSEGRALAAPEAWGVLRSSGERAGSAPVPGGDRSRPGRGAAVHCWVASWASIDSMALTMRLHGSVSFRKVFGARKSWALARGAAVSPAHL